MQYLHAHHRCTHLADDAEGARPLSVESHVLGVGLRQHDVVALLLEVTQGERVTVNVARGETLVIKNNFINK